MAEAETVPVRIKQMSDAEVLEAQLVKLSIVGKSFLCLYATLARRLYVIDVPGLPQIAGYNGLSPPRAMACGPDSRFSTLVIRHRIQSNSPRETLLTVVISGLATIQPEFENRPLSGSMSALACWQQFDIPRCGNPCSRIGFVRIGSATPRPEEMDGIGMGHA
jgi:hypothetical protein